MMSKSATTIEIDPADWLPNPTPGDILLEDFLKPLGMSQLTFVTRQRLKALRH